MFVLTQYQMRPTMAIQYKNHQFEKNENSVHFQTVVWISPFTNNVNMFK